MNVILIPGLWLDASAWDAVLPGLRSAGHVPQPLTLPGLESGDADRSQVGLADQVAAVVAAIDATDPADGQVALVGHSLGSGLATCALDQRVDRVARVFLVGGFPARDGEALGAGFSTDGADLPMPDPSEFDEADLRDFDDALLARFKARAIPSPARLTTDPVRLGDERRYGVPHTAVCTEYTADQLQEWVAGGEPNVAEFARLKDLEYVDLPTGHWPMFTRPDDLASLVAERI
jgi:pimeloyl-ACP methyl ester carboxylesterase